MLGDELQHSIDFHQTLGNNYLIVRWLGEDLRDSRTTFLNTCDTFNAIADKLKPHGIRIGYHNHGYIFETFEEDGPTLWEIFADNTVDDVVLQLDTGNAASHADVIRLLRRDPGRFATMHIKPWDPDDRDAFLGEDALDWDNILNIANESGGVDWYIVEYEREAFPPLEALQANLQNFREMRAA